MADKHREVPQKYQERLDDQMGYYSRTSRKCRKEYIWMSTIVIIINAVVPVLAIGLETDGPLKYVIASFGALATILSSVLLLRQSKETWLKCRITREKLKRERILFETCSGKYENGTDEDFISTCEEIMREEHEDWEKLHRSNEKKEE